MRYDAQTTQATSRALNPEAHKVLRNTYMLLGMCLVFATGMSYVAMAANIGFCLSRW